LIPMGFPLWLMVYASWDTRKSMVSFNVEEALTLFCFLSCESGDFLILMRDIYKCLSMCILDPFCRIFLHLSNFNNVAGNQLCEQCCSSRAHERLTVPVIRAHCGSCWFRHCAHEPWSLSQPFPLQTQI
jgi:hypothetical protein